MQFKNADDHLYWLETCSDEEFLDCLIELGIAWYIYEEDEELGYPPIGCA